MNEPIVSIPMTCEEAARPGEGVQAVSLRSAYGDGPSGTARLTVPAGVLEPGRAYVVEVREAD